MSHVVKVRKQREKIILIPFSYTCQKVAPHFSSDWRHALTDNLATRRASQHQRRLHSPHPQATEEPHHPNRSSRHTNYLRQKSDTLEETARERSRVFPSKEIAEGNGKEGGYTERWIDQFPEDSDVEWSGT